jgi:hypothetical protein
MLASRVQTPQLHHQLILRCPDSNAEFIPSMLNKFDSIAPSTSTKIASCSSPLLTLKSSRHPLEMHLPRRSPSTILAETQQSDGKNMSFLNVPSMRLLREMPFILVERRCCRASSKGQCYNLAHLLFGANCCKHKSRKSKGTKVAVSTSKET